MSRRKQAKPIRHLEDGSPVFNGEGAQVASTSLASASAGGHSDDGAEIALGSSSDPEHSSLSDHAHQDASALSEGNEGEEMEEGSSEPSANVAPNLFLKRSVDEDFANNNESLRRRLNQLEDEEAMDTDEGPTKKDPEDPVVPTFLGPIPVGGNHSMPSSNAVTEQLKNISLTISQLTSNLTSTSSNPKSVQELAVLQATLFSLQQQQLLHMQILAQMQKHHLPEESSDSSEKSKESNPMPPTIAELAKKMEVQNSILDPGHHHAKHPSLGIIPSSSISESQPDKHSRRDSLESTPLPPSLPPKSLNIPTSNVLTGKDLKVTTSAPVTSSNNAGSKSDSSMSLSSQILDPNAPSSLASSIILHPEGASEEKPVNSLELLQKRAQGILNSASQGLLANNLADFSINKDREFDKKGEPFFKHRCRYCGKVFGSDSALQIHVRSHTGERPYKCNVCGNRFTTKGNLKVHFQRHSNKFPHVKMNPNLVPEHLDKFYPPLLQLIEEAEKKGLPIAPLVQNPMAGMTPIFPPGFKLPQGLQGFQGFPPVSSAASHLLGDHVPSLPRFPLSGLGGAGSGLPPPSGLFPPFPPLPSEPLKREDVPQNLSGFNLKRSRSRSRSRSPSVDRENTEEIDVMDRGEEKRARSTDSAENRRSVSPDIVDKMSDNEDPGKEDLSGDDQPENLSKFRERSNSPSPNNDRDNSPTMPTAPSIAAKLFPNIPGLAGFPGPLRLPISRPPGMPGLPLVPPVVTSHNSVDPAKDPMIYTNLLPRPGSSDNSWESLIEIEKASDTAKLEQLVNNIENKLTDPNECVICHRVLSCKSALQMHYRTHTGERPFKCRICSRAFTTKGNLKTHMGVHRAKPPMRMFHQCPVCHKKYANALVLQQHIRTHTGEPTELTAEQIAAAEIRDFPPLPPGHPLSGGPLRHPASSLFPGAIPGYFPPVSGPGSDPMSPDIYDKDDKDSGEEKEDGTSRPSSVSSSTSSTLNTSYPMTSIPSSVTDVNRPEFRPFGLVRPIQMEKLGQLSNLLADRASLPVPEDLSRRSEDKSPPVNNGRKESTSSPAVSPPKFSPEPENSHKPEMSPKKPELNGSSLKIPVSSAVPTSAGMFSALAALERSSGSNPMGPSGMMFPGFPGLLPPTGAFPGHLLSQSPPVSVGAGSVLSQLALAGNPGAFNPLGLPGLRGLPGVPGVPVSQSGGLPMTRGNTTCQLCFKTFACNSALEIHYRSHTKERPFKCAVCDRGFSTKGNMKQHFLTHKNREGIRCSPSHSNSNPNSDCEQPKTPNALHRQSAGHDSEGSNDNSRPEAISLKRSPPEEDSLPIAKRLQGASDVSDLSLRPEDRTSPSTSTSSAELRIPATNAARNVLQFPTATAN